VVALALVVIAVTFYLSANGTSANSDQSSVPEPASTAALEVPIVPAPVPSNQAAPAGFKTNDKAYARTLVPWASVTPLLTVAEEVARTGSTTAKYRMVGIPDGMGAYDGGDGTAVLFLNHELGNTVVTQPNPGTDFTGAFVSEYILSKADGAVISGKQAFSSTSIYRGTDFLAGKDINPVTGAFARFCSGYLAGPHVGFDRYIYLTGEESEGTATFDKTGGLGVAIFGGAAYTLPDLGRYAKENMVVVPGTGNLTVVIVLEDGPRTPDSQVYMYVGTKNMNSPFPVVRNGLVGGKLYTLVSKSAEKNSEATFHKADGAIDAGWVEIPNAASLTEVALNTATKSAGSINFIRVEDGAYDRNTPGVFYFVTTGSPHSTSGGKPDNYNGRLYKLTFDPANPAAGATKLQILLDGDDGAPFKHPDNIETSPDGLILLQEDMIGDTSRGVNLGGRDAAIWVYDPVAHTIYRVAEVNQMPVPAEMREIAGHWETSGAIQTYDIFGPGTFLINVQAHSLNSARASTLQGSATDLKVAEGGQLLLLRLD
jgi:secreted PhoX family phosphatase